MSLLLRSPSPWLNLSWRSSSAGAFHAPLLQNEMVKETVPFQAVDGASPNRNASPHKVLDK